MKFLKSIRHVKPTRLTIALHSFAFPVLKIFFLNQTRKLAHPLQSYALMRVIADGALWRRH